MQKLITVLFCCLFLFFNTDAQTTDTTYVPASPVDGFASVLQFFNRNVNLSRAETQAMAGKLLTVELQLDTLGQVQAVNVSGTELASIIEKVQTTCLKLPAFYPSKYYGKAIEDAYFFTISYDEATNDTYLPPTYQRLTLDDFEFIEEGNFRMDIYIAGLTNNHVGNIDKHLGWGGGMSVGMLFGSPRFSAGFDMSFYGNGLQRDFIVNDNRAQNNAPPTLFLGAIAAHELKTWNNSALSVQVNASMVVLNVISTDNPDLIAAVQIWGFSPGVRAMYSLNLGVPKFMLYDQIPTIFRNKLQFHVGFYPQLMGDVQANGLNIDLGIGYKMSLNAVDSYQLK